MRLETPQLPLTLEKWPTRLKRPGWATGLGALIMALYIVLLPFIARTWRTTGDEPHYLLAAHSLATDLDYDLTNNYAQLDYLDFYFSKDITPQVRLSATGRQILDHYPALPFLITPAYTLGGRLGVLLFQALLGGVLAGLIFKLSMVISQDKIASLLATLGVTLTPPLLLYHYLIYPELIAALLVTAVLYLLITQDKPASTSAAIVMLSLALLPWLNRRFIPMAGLLALLVLWSWRSRSGQEAIRGFFRSFSGTGLASLMVALLSIAGIIWFNSQLQAPERIDVSLPASPGTLWLRLVRGVGWLLDQQRGLFIYGPIYIAALWGLPFLVISMLKGRYQQGFILLPFLLSLGAATLAGGFWVAWELGPRFLVVALPALAPLLALAWRYYRHWLWRTVFLLLWALSLLNSLVIIQNSELPYKSSLPLFYSQSLSLPLTGWLPDLADYILISPAETEAGVSKTASPTGEPVWFASPGQPVNLIKTEPLYTLPYGHYLLEWPILLDPIPAPEVELIRISINLLGGGFVFNHLIKGADLAGNEQAQQFKARFLNTNVDRWRTPMILLATTTGQAEVGVQTLRLSPDPFYAVLLPYLYLALLAGAAVITWYYAKPARQIAFLTTELVPTTPPVSAIFWFLLLVPLLACFYLVYTQTRPGHTYEAGSLYHFVGQAITDPQAREGQAWSVDPAVDPPQKAIYGPFDFYEAGHYQVTFRVKLPGEVEEDLEIARLRVSATANFEPLLTQPLLASHFSKTDLYHDLVLTITNPRRQALSFEVEYLGVAPLVIDEVTITRVKE